MVQQGVCGEPLSIHIPCFTGKIQGIFSILTFKYGKRIQKTA
jgi:hypothetical protein